MTEATEISLQRQFPCKQCGASLEFAPGTDSLICPRCGTKNSIESRTPLVGLLDYQLFADQSGAAEDHHETLLIHCSSCGAQTRMAENVAAGRCAFCGSPLVAESQSKKLIKPLGLLPFIIDKKKANELFKAWIKGLWFAPGELSKRAEQAGIDGAYIPAWTYNADTTTQYVGQRGDDYQETQTYTEYVNGHPEVRTRVVIKTRWWPVSGVVQNRFNDLLILATQSLPAKQARALEPWDLNHLVGYADEYLSGMACQTYQVDLRQGYEQAQNILMAPIIMISIQRDIGGDHQQVSSASTQYYNVKFRHILLPLWISAYRFNSRVFRFLVNARTGEVQGERPWSAMKIAALVLTILLAILIIIWIGASHSR